MKKYLTINLLFQVIIITLLVVPLLGILRNYDQSLADIELGDPVELFFSYPDFMKYFRLLIFAAIGCSIFPWTRKFYGICLGVCLGGLLFFYLNTMSDLKALSEMGLSQTPLEEMITLTEQGKSFAFWCVSSAICHVIAMIVECIASSVAKKEMLREKV